MGTYICLLFTLQTWLPTVTYRLKLRKATEQRYPMKTTGAVSGVVLAYTPLVHNRSVYGKCATFVLHLQAAGRVWL